MLFGLTNSKRVKRCCLVENPRTGEKMENTIHMNVLSIIIHMEDLASDGSFSMTKLGCSSSGILKHLCRVEAAGNFCHVLLAILFNLALEVSPGLAFHKCLRFRC